MIETTLIEIRDTLRQLLDIFRATAADAPVQVVPEAMAAVQSAAPDPLATLPRRKRRTKAEIEADAARLIADEKTITPGSPEAAVVSAAISAQLEPPSRGILRTQAQDGAADPLAGEEFNFTVTPAERKNVSAVLITASKRADIGSQKAFELMKSFGGAATVDALNPADYTNLVKAGAKLLGITYEQALALDPTKS